MEDYKFLFKVVLVGNAGVGKCISSSPESSFANILRFFR